MKYHISFDIDFKRNTGKGLYIAIEGIDGSGKTTQVKRLADYFTKKGKQVVVTREPRYNGDGVISKLIREILQGKTKIPPVAFQYLFSADREMHHEELILPSLRQGKVVISDRCFWSAIPYGIMDRGGAFKKNSLEYLLVSQSILSLYHQFTVPDKTFYLDVPLTVAMERLHNTHTIGSIYEDEKKLKKTIEGYQWLLQEFPKEFTIIDANRSVDSVAKEILSQIKE